MAFPLEGTWTIDGSRFPLIAQRDPIAGELQRRIPGLRPVCRYSAYEAATWAIISQRIGMRQATAIKARIAESLNVYCRCESSRACSAASWSIGTPSD